MRVYLGTWFGQGEVSVCMSKKACVSLCACYCVCVCVCVCGVCVCAYL